MGFFFKSKSSADIQKESLERIARNMGVFAFRVKYHYVEGLMKQKVSLDNKKSILEILARKKQEEAKIFKINPEDTGAALMESWTIEYLNGLKVSEKPKSQRDEMRDIVSKNPEILAAIASGDESLIQSALKNNPDALLSIAKSFDYEDKPAQKYLHRAIEQQGRKKDAFGAIKLINLGLSFHEPETAPFLYSLRAKCQLDLLNYEEALEDINQSIALLLRDFPENSYNASNFLNERAEIKSKLGNEKGAYYDRKLAEQYYAKFEAEESEDDDLPY